MNKGSPNSNQAIARIRKGSSTIYRVKKLIKTIPLPLTLRTHTIRGKRGIFIDGASKPEKVIFFWQ